MGESKKPTITAVGGRLLMALALSAFPLAALAEDESPKSIRMTCGTCPPGYAKTGVTQAPQVCKDGDPVLVECVPIGAMNLLAVCGSCPEGYRQVGGSSVPARCGSEDGGRMSQCQLEKFESNLPDPSKGGLFCPPNCVGTMPTPGQGAMPPPPKYTPTPSDASKEAK
ncbi:MAG: hypothetical protein ACKOCD_05240 [Nitrospiraceae bacterium]